MAKLIEEGFLDSDYDGSSGEFSDGNDDDDSSYSDGDDIDNDDVNNDNNCIQQKKEMKSNDNILSSSNVVINVSDISDVSTADIMNIKSKNDHHEYKQTQIQTQTQTQTQQKEKLKQEMLTQQRMLKEQMEEMKSYSTEEEEGEEEEEEEEEESEVTENNMIFCATFRRISISSTSAYYSDREHYKYDTDYMTEDSELYENYKYDEISDKIFNILQSKQRRNNELCQMIIIDFDDNIYQIIGEYSESATYL